MNQLPVRTACSKRTPKLLSYFTALLVFAGAPLAATAQWTRHVAPGYTTASFGDCFMLSEDRIFGLAALGNIEGIMETTNGGKTWTGKAAEGMWMFDLTFTDANHGYIVGRDNEQAGGFVLATENGGKTWTSNLMTETHGFYAVSFPTPQVGYTCGYLGVIWKTIDAGKTWNTLYAGQTTDVFTEVCFVTPEVGYVAAGQNSEFYSVTQLYRTVDGGENWTLVKGFADEESIGVMVFLDRNTGYITSKYEGKTAIMKTTDGGQTWAPSYTNAENQLITSIRFTDANNGFAVGNHGLIIRTTDAGATWIDESFPTDAMLLDVDAYGNTAMVVGSDGVILKRSLAPAGVAISETGTGALEIVPNPLSASGTLRATQLRPGQQYNLLTYDLQGTLVRSSAGVADGSDIPVERGDLPAGSYFFRLLTGNEVAGRGRFVVR